MWISSILIIGIICGVLAVITGILFFVFWHLNETTWKEYDAAEVLSGVGAFIFAVFAIVMIILGALETHTYNTEYNEFVCNLVSLRTQTNTEGHFCLGTGNIGGKDYYYYGYESAYGFGQDKTLVSKSFIVEDDTKTPSLYHIKVKGLDTERYIYYVPTGTIKVYYNVN